MATLHNLNRQNLDRAGFGARIVVWVRARVGVRVKVKVRVRNSGPDYDSPDFDREPFQMRDVVMASRHFLYHQKLGNYTKVGVWGLILVRVLQGVHFIADGE